MPDTDAPIISMDGEGEAIVIQRNLPEPVAYRGNVFIELDFVDGGDAHDFFEDTAFEVPPDRGGRPFSDYSIEDLTTTVHTAMRGGFSDPRIFPNARPTSTSLRMVERPNPGTRIEGSVAVAPELSELEPEAVAVALKAGKRLHIYQNLIGGTTYRFIPEPAEPTPGIYLVERYQLSTHLGRYGAGRVVKTFSLLPGERTKISVRSFLKTETDRKEASSILDSVTHESAQDFQTTLEQEQSDRKGYEKTFDYHAEAEASGSWGFGSVKVSGGIKGGSNAAREETSKNVAKAVEQHSAKSSAKRDVEVNTSFEVKKTVEDETSIEREVENINVSRTLNFVFRQMTQEFLSLLHLIDVRIAFFNGYSESRYEVPLYKLDSLLTRYVKPEHHEDVHTAIDDALGSIADYAGTVQTDFVVTREIDGQPYRRVNRELVSEYSDPVTGTTRPVSGVIVAATANVMRTEGMMVEAMLGTANALDRYATRLQDIEVSRRDAELKALEAEAERSAILNEIVRTNDAARAGLLERLTCPCGRGHQRRAHTDGDHGAEEARGD